MSSCNFHTKVVDFDKIYLVNMENLSKIMRAIFDQMALFGEFEKTCSTRFLLSDDYSCAKAKKSLLDYLQK